VVGFAAAVLDLTFFIVRMVSARVSTQGARLQVGYGKHCVTVQKIAHGAVSHWATLKAISNKTPASNMRVRV
jgi:hypothetical protein